MTINLRGFLSSKIGTITGLVSIVGLMNPLALAASGVTYRNPRVYNVDYSFELFPDPAKIDRTKDLKLWIPIPREWDSQKAVKIISVQPPPHAEYEDPEYGNPMLFWDFGKGAQKPSYRVDIKFRLESSEVHVEVDPNRIGPYDKTSKEYALYTRSEHTICITPRIQQMAEEAVGDEKNPYLQARRIAEFVRKKTRYKVHRHDRGVGTKVLLNHPIRSEETGEVHYEGACFQHSVLFIALCRAIGIPARMVSELPGWGPWIKEEDLKLYKSFEVEISPDGLAAAQHYMALGIHNYAEFFIPNYGWVPVDVGYGRFGHQGNKKIIMSKGPEVQIGPQAPQKQSEGYGFQSVGLTNGRVDMLQKG